MAYCAVSDVNAIEAGRNITFSDSPATVPTSTQVTGFINQIYEEINQTILRAGYRIPITTTNYLLQCNAMGAAWMVEIALNVSGTNEANNVINTRRDAYLRMLESIKQNPKLSGAIPALGNQNNTATSDGVVNYDNANAPFKVSNRDW